MRHSPPRSAAADHPSSERRVFFKKIKKNPDSHKFGIWIFVFWNLIFIMAFFGLFNKEKKESLDQGLSKTKENFFSRIARAVAGKSEVDAEVLDNL